MDSPLVGAAGLIRPRSALTGSGRY